MELKYFAYYLIGINIIAFMLYAIDKLKAIKHHFRIREATLLSVAFIGGSLGSLLAMYIFHHKTRKKAFSVGIPLMMIVQVAVLLYCMNVGSL